MVHNGDVAEDPRPAELRTTMAKGWAAHEEDYRSGDGYTVVHEGEERAIIADHTGTELDEYIRMADCEVHRRTVLDWMSQVAHEGTNHDWRYADPLVFDLAVE